jgi:hypothetical protein
MADPDVGVIQLATVNNSRGPLCEEETKVHCYRAGTGSSNAQVCTGRETATRSCEERDKGQEVSADAGRTEESEK